MNRYRILLFPEDSEDYIDEDNPVLLIDAYAESFSFYARDVVFLDKNR